MRRVVDLRERLEIEVRVDGHSWQRLRRVESEKSPQDCEDGLWGHLRGRQKRANLFRFTESNTTQRGDRMHPQARVNHPGRALGVDTNWSDRFVMTHS